MMRTSWWKMLAGGCLVLAALAGCSDEPDNGNGSVLTDAGPDAAPDVPTTTCSNDEAEESCNGLDSDNDGVVDDGCPCNFEGVSVGVCENGVKQCDGSCAQPEFYMEEESGESACDGRDNDCDGTTDEVDDISCELSQGVCEGANLSCNAGSFGSCGPDDYGRFFHSPERLCDGLDNNCDGNADDGCSFSIFDGTSSDDRMNDADTAPGGQLYAAGASNGGLGESNGQSNNSFDAVLARYNSNGAEAWIENLGSDADDRAHAVDVGPDGDIVVVGDTFGDLTGEGLSLEEDRDGFVAKYDDAGNQQWITSVRTDASDSLNDVAVLPDGRIAVVGTTRGEFDSDQQQTGVDAIIAVMSEDGDDIEWRAQLASDQFAYDGFDEVLMGGSGGLYAVGETEGEFIGNESAFGDSGDTVVAKYGTDGSPKWISVFGRDVSEDKPYAATPVVADDQSGIWVAGATQKTVGDSGTNRGQYDGYLLRVDGSGEGRANFNFGSLETDRVFGLTVATGGDSNEVYVLGDSNGNLIGSERAPVVGETTFLARVQVGGQSGATLDGVWFGTPETTESALVRRGDGGVVAVGYHQQTDFLQMTPEGGEDFFLIEHRPFSSGN